MVEAVVDLLYRTKYYRTFRLFYLLRFSPNAKQTRMR